jgi:hypothetical protein
MSPTYTDRPIYWLVLLEQARQRGDHHAAAEARRELARLGVRVTYRRERDHQARAAAGGPTHAA